MAASAGHPRAGREDQTVGDVACHRIDDQMLFVTQLSGGDAVLRSLDGGATFAPFANGLENVVAPVELAFAGEFRASIG